MKYLMLLIIGCFSLGLFAQDREVSGRITTPDGEPLIGVNILIQGTSRGALSGQDGSFTLRVPPGADTLRLSYIGFEPRKVAIGARTNLSITLQEEIATLDQVVVIGYGTKKKRDVIGSVSSINTEEIAKVPSISFVAGLQGRATGLQVTSSSGVPGAPSQVRIRGINSISIGTEPLWIIDGMPMYAGSGLESTRGATKQDPMSLINPNDIESVQILKDAAATAIYGSRGSNGVIIITTKSGTKDKGELSLNYSYGITDLSRSADDIGFTNTREWFELVETARQNSNNGEFTPFVPASITNLFRDDPVATLSREEALAVNTDWFDQILRRGNFQDINLSGTQGFKNGSLYASMGYRKDESVLINNQLERYSARLNTQFSPFEGFSLEARLNFSYTQNDRVKQQVAGATGNNSGGNSGGFGNANRNTLPWFPIYNADHVSGYWNPMSGNNLIAMVDRELMLDQVENYRGIGGVFLEYRLPWIEGLSVRTELSFDLIQNNSVNWIAAILRENGSYAVEQATTRRSINYNAYAKYDREFGDHSLSLTAGTESQTINQYLRLMEGQNLTGTYQELGNPQDYLSMTAGLNGEEYLRAYFGRADYKFKNRYLFGLSFRRDGSSKFNETYRWGFFPALSFGWIMTDEAFMEALPAFNLLKLRGSYGQTGNKNIPSNRFVTTYSNRSNWRYGGQEVILEGTRITNIGVPSLTWETTSSYDAGVDFGLFNNRVNGSVAYYFQDVTDLLLSSPLALSAGLEGNQIWGNVGDMQNFGLEFEVHSINVHRGELMWTTDFNLTTNRNKVVRLTPDLDRSGRGIISGNTLSKTGGRLRAYYMAEDAGVDPERGVNLIYEIDIEHFEQTGETVKTGRTIPATLNNLQNHRIIHEDRTAVPTFFGGLNNVLEYKGFDLTLFFTFAGGNYLYDYEEQRTTDVQYGQVVLRKELMGNTWTPENPDAKYPELRWQGTYDWTWDPEVENPDSPTGKGDWVEGTGNYKNETVNWTKYLYRGDFIRLRTLQFGYSFPSPVLDRLRLKQLRLFVTANNTWTWTREYEGWDPESGGGTLPSLEIWMGGISIKF